MPSPELLLLAPLPGTLQSELEAAYACHDGSSPGTLQPVLAEHGAAIGALVGNGGSRVSRALIDQLPALEIIVINGVGYDGVDLAACRARGIRVTNTPDVLTEDVADTVAALVLMTSRRLLAANRFLQAGDWNQGQFPLSHALAGKVAGIVGLGRIGKAAARRLEAFGMTVAYHGRQRQDVPQTWHPTLPGLAAAADFLVVCCPGGPGTHHLISDGVLAALGPNGVLINVARGSVVDETALTRRLETGQLRAAGLDVFEHEPQVPAELRNHPDAVLLPHVGSATIETRTAMGRLCLDNLQAHFNGQPLRTPVC